MRRIFITGCSRSGTTLLKRLFYAFKDVAVFVPEVYLDELVQTAPCLESKRIIGGIPEKKDCPAYGRTLPVLIGKRRCKSVFSNHLSEEEVNRQLALIREHNVEIVNIIRDKVAVTQAKNWPVPVWRWNASVIQARTYGEYIKCQLEYEELVADPDGVQKLVANSLGLEIVHPWSVYPGFVADSEFDAAGDEKYAARRIEMPRLELLDEVLEEVDS